MASNNGGGNKKTSKCAYLGSGMLRSACESMTSRPTRIETAIEGSISKKKKKKNK
jgi:hypothetical protein